jgi:hypothetical protein
VYENKGARWEVSWEKGHFQGLIPRILQKVAPFLLSLIASWDFYPPLSIELLISVFRHEPHLTKFSNACYRQSTTSGTWVC